MPADGLSPLPPLPALDAAAQQRLAGCLAMVRQRMRAAEAAAGRPAGSVQLLAVTKTFGAPVVAAAARLGQQRFGENYVQEAVAKIDALRRCPGLPALEWHFIGPIQSNKTRSIAAHFDWVQSVDRMNIAQRLSDQRPPQLAPLQALIEVNISGEASKSGVDPAHLPALALAIGALPRLRLRGLMAIPEPGLAAAAQREAFERLHGLLETVRATLAADPQGRAAAPGIDTLSMGMSADFEAAIGAGSTMVRVGSAIFGERT